MKLNNQIEIPELGLGVFQIPNDETADVVKNAIVNGYRLIDTAKIYENEEGTGQGIKEGLAMTGHQSLLFCLLYINLPLRSKLLCKHNVCLASG